MPHRVTKERGTVPAWLSEDDVIYYDCMPGLHSLHSSQFRDAGAFCINDTHWAVRPLKVDLTPWAGGKTAPTDYGGGPVMKRDGEMYNVAPTTRWTHVGTSADIIGYPKRAAAPVAPPPSLAAQLHQVMHPDASPWQSTEAHERGARFIIQRERETLDKLKELFRALHAKHFKQPAPPYILHDDISGVIDQIDNLTTVWNAPDPDSVTIARMTEAEAVKLGADYMFDWDQYTDACSDFATHVFYRLGLIKPDPQPTILEQFAKEANVKITEENRADIVKALSWHRSTGKGE